ncbi:MAG TPA: tripartite tricarboxylate transporter substrate binding protein [Burkholderiaceae bacterium]|jgi:tripartite-type tricarboxylate transporter receptor subunit TctC|nr:tripartite tricarboxylate transporter substrate binding protein [Burkholderiaceae bacterium]
MKTLSRLMLWALLALVPLAPAWAQSWPAKPIRLIVPYPPGGQTDIVSRWLGEQLAPVLGQPIIIENRAGAQGIVGLRAGKEAAGDGYTFIYANVSNLVINRFAYEKLPYDPVNDFEMVTQLGLAVLGMAVPSSLGLKTVDDFVKYARNNPGKTTFASFGEGSSSHLYGEMLKHAAKLDMVHVPYKGAGPAVQDIVAGNATMGIHDFAATGPFLQSGRLVVLAVTGPKRWPLQPDVKTFSEQGYPLDLAGWNGIIAPKGTPAAVVDRMSREINKIIQTPQGRERMLQMGLLVTGTTPAEFKKLIEDDTPRWGEVFKRSGIKAQ